MNFGLFLRENASGIGSKVQLDMCWRVPKQPSVGACLIFHSQMWKPPEGMGEGHALPLP